MTVSVLRAGFSSTVQDLGRPGFIDQGISVGGALDANALAVANLLVGNDPGAAGLEVTNGRVQMCAADDRLISWCGGAFTADLAGTRLAAGRAAFWHAGEEIIFTSQGGPRAWLAISGGIDVPLVLGSRSTDLRSGFGGWRGRALADGDLLPLGATSARSEQFAARLRLPCRANCAAPNEWSAPAMIPPVLRVVRGADWARFEPSAQAALTSTAFEVTPDADRMGVRLSGPGLGLRETADLISEAVVPGTLQVPPNAQPILLLGDCQTIGGYPKIAHVIKVDLPRGAQLRAGERVRFVAVSVEEAQRLWRERQRDLAWFRAGLSLQMT
ncbi:MAG: biotin-dependent carboxyltransferase family protein [Chthoniobacterales bacterium]